MNDLITKLAKQADHEYTGEHDDDMGHAIVGDEAISMFTELIVKECMFITMAQTNIAPEHHNQIVTAMNNHIGINQ